jgi:hypothetical protein
MVCFLQWNKKCTKCNESEKFPKHDCWKNCYRSAKALKLHVAKRLVVDSAIFESENVEVGMLIGDDGSSTIAACQAASFHPIIKQSNVNHASGGIKKQLYGSEKSHQELTKYCTVFLQ